jgi:UDP-glucose 4-epimerase
MRQSSSTALGPTRATEANAQQFLTPESLMRAIVTGGAGFIGSHVSQRLIADGHDVLVVDDLSGGFRTNLPESASFAEMSVCDPLDELFQRFRPDAVYHLAAYAAEGLSHHIPVFNYTNNVVGTANVLGSAYRSGAQHFVFASSIAVYGHPPSERPFTEETPPDPVDPYGIAKLACEQHIRSFAHYYGGPTFTVFRPHNVFGPRQNVADPYRNVVGIFMACALAGKAMPIFGDGTQTRSFSYIDVVSDAIARSPMIPDAANRTFNIGGDEPMTVRELARTIASEFGVPDAVEFLPARKEVLHAHCEHERAQAVFADAYRAHSVDIRSGLHRMAQFVRSQSLTRPTECPSPIEIKELLPPSWAERLPSRNRSR